MLSDRLVLIAIGILCLPSMLCVALMVWRWFDDWRHWRREVRRQRAFDLMMEREAATWGAWADGQRDPAEVIDLHSRTGWRPDGAA